MIDLDEYICPDCPCKATQVRALLDRVEELEADNKRQLATIRRLDAKDWDVTMAAVDSVNAIVRAEAWKAAAAVEVPMDLHIQFRWEDEDDEDHSLSYHSSHIPGRGDTVSLVWKDDDCKPELTSMSATVDNINWEFNSDTGPYPTIWLRDTSKQRTWTPT